MKSAFALVHLNVARRFPRLVSWVPARRRKQVRTPEASVPHTWVLARDEARFWAWVGQNVPAGQRSGYRFLARAGELDGFRGTVQVLPGAWSRQDASELVEAVEARVQCGAVRWAA